MDRLLEKGDVFRVKKLRTPLKFVYKTFWTPDTKLLKLNENRVTVDYGWPIHWTEKQTMIYGWSRELPRIMDPVAKNVDHITWRVTSVRECGGSGPYSHDPYPDGWFVVAENIDDPEQTLEFYQSGCFIPEILPENIKLVKEK